MSYGAADLNMRQVVALLLLLVIDIVAQVTVKPSHRFEGFLAMPLGNAETMSCGRSTPRS